MSERPRDGVPRPGQMLAEKYRVERLLGAGGMGIVLEATHVLLGERVAIKLLHPELGLTGARYVRFVREARAASGIRSDHVVRVFDLGTLADGSPYIAMEFLAGVDLATLLERDGRLPVQRAVDYVLQACEGVAEAHARRVIHRDLKPANLFLTRRSDHSPCIKVLDFGISKIASEDTPTPADEGPTDASLATDATKDDDAPASARGRGRDPVGGALTHTRARLGSPMYSSPEQLRSPKHIDARTDVWSLGVILFELLTAKHAFDAPSYDELREKIATTDAPRARDERSEIPEGLDAVIARCMRKGPDERFADVGELATALAPFGSEDGARSAARAVRILRPGDAGDPIAPPGIDVFAPTVDPSGTPRSTAGGARGRGRIAAGAIGAIAIAAALVALRAKGTRATTRHDEGAITIPDAAIAASAPAKGRRVLATTDFVPEQGAAGSWLGVALGDLARERLTADESIRVVTTEGLATFGDAGAPIDAKKCAALRTALGADVVIAGSYRASGTSRDDALDVRVAAYRSDDGAKLAEGEASGRVGDAFALVDRLVEAIRTPIGLHGLAESEAEALRASQPANPDVLRLLAEADARNAAGDQRGTLRALDDALALDPTSPRVLVERVMALDNLERDNEIPAATAAALAAIPRLPRAERLPAEARVRALTEDDAKAAETFEMLAAMYPDEPSYAIPLATHLARAGKLDEAQQVVDRLRAMPPPAGDDPEVDFVEMEIAIARGDRRRDEAMARKALATAIARGLDAEAATARFSIARSLIAQGDNAHVMPWIDQARADFERLGDVARVADLLISSSRVKRRALDLAGARADLEKARAIERAQGALQREATVVIDLGTVAEVEGDHRRAKGLAEEAIGLARRAAPGFGGSKAALAGAETDLLRSALDLGDPAGARRRLAQHAEDGDVKAEAAERAQVATLLGRAAFEAGDLDAAARELEAVHARYEQDGRRANAAAVATTLAEVERARGDATKGESWAAKALATATSLGQPALAEPARVAHGRALLARSRAKEAEAEARAALDVVRGKALDVEIAATALLADALAAEGDAPGARAVLEGASARTALGQRPFVALDARLTEARVLAAGGDRAGAERVARGVERDATRLGMRGIAREAARVAASAR